MRIKISEQKLIEFIRNKIEKQILSNVENKSIWRTKDKNNNIKLLEI